MTTIPIFVGSLTIFASFVLILRRKSVGWAALSSFLPSETATAESCCTGAVAQRSFNIRQSTESGVTNPTIAIIVLQPDTYNQLDLALNRMLIEYRTQYYQAMQGLSQMLEHAIAVERAMCLLSDTDNEVDNLDAKFDSSMLMSAAIRRRINRTIECVEHDEKVLERLLSMKFVQDVVDDDAEQNGNSTARTNIQCDTSISLSVHMALPQTKPAVIFQNMTNDNEDEGIALTITSSDKNQHSYETATQIIAHLVRDWTKEGRSVRSSIYDWVCSQVLTYTKSIVQSFKKTDDGDFQEDQSNDKHVTHTMTVLVPGSGMGRLAYEISKLQFRRNRRQHHLCYKYNVEANEISISMSVAAASVISTVLNNQQRQNQCQQQTFDKKSKRDWVSNTTVDKKSSAYGPFAIHPFVMDNLSNEIDVENRYESVHFPDIDCSDDQMEDVDVGAGMGSVSFTVGDFGSQYYTHERAGQYDFIITAFFLDTAHNVYQYISSVKTLLKSKDPCGIWINVGPVQWHKNSLFRPSVDELRNIIEHAFGFHILHWAIDNQPIAYRDGQDSNRYTNYEGYRPLRFVASLCGSL